ncbi:MAG: ComEC/Rec2 family competence protein [Thermoleophilaceae bacterium]|nr:ComEC/Rec2 family competence protein [Thermoleophilaceae bacterium]
MRGHAIERLRIELRSRPQLVGLCAFVLGLLACRAPLAAVAALAVAAGAVGAGCGGRHVGLLAAAAVAVGAGAGAARVAALDAPLERLHPGRRIDALLELRERPRPGRFGWSAAARILSGTARGAGVLVRSPGRVPRGLASRGDRAWAAGLLQPLPGGPGGEGYARHLRATGVGAVLAAESLRAAPRGRGPAALVDALRRRAERALARGLSPDHAALAAGMVLGEDDRIAPEARDDFRRSGLAHLIAVSGQNVALLGALALPMLSAAGLGLRARSVALLALIGVYVPLAGAGPPLQRAGVMGAAGLLALLAGRAASRWYALALAAAVTLLVDPRAAAEPGWQLSFAAVAGMLALVAPLARALGALPRPVADGLAATLAASLATAPLIAHHFGTLPAWSLAANLLALPAVAPAMWLGMGQIALAAVAPEGGPAGALAASVETLLGRAAGVPLDWLEQVARWFAAAPGATLAVSLPSPAAVVAAYAAIAGACAAAARCAARLEPWAHAVAAEWRRLPRAERAAARAAACVAVAAAVWQATGPAAPPRALTVSFLDVGQGDATLIQDPGGAAVLFDGGPPEARVALKLRRLGVRRLSAVVATHQSRDHHGGLAEVLRSFPVDLFLDNGDGTTDPTFVALEREADRLGVPRVLARAGQRLRAGRLDIRILSPRPRPPGPPPEDPNVRAVVAVVSEGGFDLMLSADAESPSLLPLRLPRVDAMKVPHHGSADPGLPRLLERLRPKVAAIEVGAGNPYGHPRPSTLAALARRVPHVYRTDRDGTVRLTVRDGRMIVSTAR